MAANNMVKTTDEEFIAIWKKWGSTTLVSKVLGISKSNIIKRRTRIEKKYNIELPLFNSQHHNDQKKRYKGRLEYNIQNGRVLVFSDAHYYPDIISTAHKALISFINHFHPEYIVCNGDAFDGSTISRYPRIGWDDKPTVKQELEAVTDRLGEIEMASKGKLIWTLGNHDARFETFLAANAPQFEGITGLHLKDHFPRWVPAWSCWFNDEVVIKHRWKGGVHATHNNAAGSGKTMVTGHLHSLKVTPYTDYNGTRYGVDTGTLAEPNGPQFIDYSEDAPKNHRSGFALLTFQNGVLLQPELIQVHDEEQGIVDFRGQLIYV